MQVAMDKLGSSPSMEKRPQPGMPPPLVLSEDVGVFRNRSRPPSGSHSDSDGREPGTDSTASTMDYKDSLVKAEELQEALTTLRERARAAERLFKRLAEAERAATKSLRRALAKVPPLVPGEFVSKARLGGSGRLQWLFPRIQALLDQRASQGESLAGVWDSEHRRWSARGASIQDTVRRILEGTRSTAKDLSASRTQAERLHRKHAACRIAAVQALRTRDAVDKQTKIVDLAAACGGPSKQEQKMIKAADSAFRDYMLTKQELTRHGPVLQKAEDQCWSQIRSVVALCQEEQGAFLMELRESLQLAIGSLNVFSLTNVDVHSELLGNGVDTPSSTSPLLCDTHEMADGDTSSCSSCDEAPMIPGTRIGALSQGQEAERPTPSGQETAELSEVRCARLETDRMILKALQTFFGGLREAEDHVLRGCGLAQVPSASPTDPEHVNEASKWLRDVMQVRVETSGALSTFLVERLSPILEQHLGEARADGQVIQEEQRRTVNSISSQAQARQQKLSEVPSLGQGQLLTNRDSELIFHSRMVRILGEMRQRASQRGRELFASVQELWGIEHGRVHTHICDTAPNTLRRLAAAACIALHKSEDISPKLSGPPSWPPESAICRSAIASSSAEVTLLEAEERRVKVIARAIGDFTGRDGFAFHVGQDVRVTLQVSDTWVGLDTNGTFGEFPSHLVEVDGRNVDGGLPDRVTLFKRHVLESEDYAPSAEDEEFASRFAEYLRSDSSKISERVLANYSCALLTSRKVPLQGRIYFTSRCVGFFSHFNDSTLLGDTVILFRLSEISKIEKRTNALIFQNSIEVSLQDGVVHFFTSFWHRDDAFEYLSNLHSVWKHVSEEGINEGLQIGDAAISKVEQACEVFFVLPAASSAPYPACPQDNTLALRSPFKYELPGRVYGISLQDVFDTLFRDFGPNSFQAEFEAERGSRVVGSIAPAWNIEPDLGAAAPTAAARQVDDECAICQENLPQRQVQLKRPVQAAAWMRRIGSIPECCDCIENWSFHGLGAGTGFVVQLDTEVSGLPYTDYFVYKIRYKAIAISDLRTQLDAEVELDWKKSTLLQSRIEQSTTDEFRRVFDTQFLPLATRVLKRVAVVGRGCAVNDCPQEPQEPTGEVDPAVHDNLLQTHDDVVTQRSSHKDRAWFLLELRMHTVSLGGKLWCTFKSNVKPLFHFSVLIALVGFAWAICRLLATILSVLLRLEIILEKMLELQNIQNASSLFTSSSNDEACFFRFLR